MTVEYSDEPYVTITADTHAGASHATYREYLDPQYRAAFDEYRGGWKSEMRAVHSKKTKNWDSEERFRDLEADGVCAEVIFPNTVPPFYRRAFHLSPPPSRDQYELQLAGTRAHNRWLKDFCAIAPERRAGVGLIHLNNLDDTLADIEWIANAGLRGGVLLPLPPDDRRDQFPPLISKHYERVWAAIQDHDIPITQHSGVGAPDFGDNPGAQAMWMQEIGFWGQRGFKSLLLGGVFERYPQLRFILTEAGCNWVPELLQQMDAIHHGIKSGHIGEMQYENVMVLKEPPSYYAKRNCWYGASFPGPREIDGRHEIGLTQVCWGSDYPHHEGTFPDTRLAMRWAFAGLPEKEVRMMLGENAAKLYKFDLEALKPIAQRVGVLPKDIALPLLDIPDSATAPTLKMARAKLRGESAPLLLQ